MKKHPAPFSSTPPSDLIDTLSVPPIDPSLTKKEPKQRRLGCKEVNCM